MKTCVWLGPPDCYRQQDRVLRTPSIRTSARHRSNLAIKSGRNGKHYKEGTLASVAAERGGTTPFNLLPISNGQQPGGGKHPAKPPATWRRGGADTLSSWVVSCSIRLLRAESSLRRDWTRGPCEWSGSRRRRAT